MDIKLNDDNILDIEIDVYLSTRSDGFSCDRYT